MKNFQKITKEEYKEFLDKVLFKTFFHSPEWQEFLEREFKWLKFEYYLYKPARPVGGDQSLLSFGRIGNKLISLPFCEYGGPIPLRENFNIEQFGKDVLEEFENIKIKFHPQIKPGNPDSEVSTHWVDDLKNLNADDLFTSFRKTLRHSIKNAENQGLEIKMFQFERIRAILQLIFD